MYPFLVPFPLSPPPQPLPDQKAQLYNQLTLKSLSEQDRQSYSHAFKFCKKYQVCMSL